MIAATSLVAVWGLGSVQVLGATTCPPPAAVQAQLQSNAGDSRDGDRAELIAFDGWLSVQLLDRDGHRVNERRLALASPCSSLTAAAATVISAMELELRNTPQVDIESTPKAAPPPEALQTSASLTPSTPPKSRRVTFDIGAMVLVSVADAAPAGAFLVGVGKTLRLETGFFLDFGRQELLFDGGKASYQRYWVPVGLGYVFRFGKLSLEPQLALQGAYVTLAGDGTSSASRGSVWDAGVAGAVTAQWSFGPVAVWAGGFLSVWPGGTKVEITTLAQARPLPALDFLLGGGLRFGPG